MIETFKKTKLYFFLLNCFRFRHAFYNIGKPFGFFDIITLSFYNLIGKREKEVYLKNLGIYAKSNFFVITTLIEVFNIELYKSINGLEHVLDLGGYIGESAVYLSKQNKNIITYEPSEKKFALLKKNISNFPSIVGHNKAVVGDPLVESLNLWERDGYDFCSSNMKHDTLPKKVTVKCIDILSVMSNHQFDGLKMDIEGGEFEILDVLLKEGIFPFKKGVIEFHFGGTEGKSKQDKFIRFCEFLSGNGYTYTLYDNFNNKIKMNTVLLPFVLNLSFTLDV